MSQEKIVIKSKTSAHDYTALRHYYLYKRNRARTRALVFILLLSFGLLVISGQEFALPFFRLLGTAGIFVIALVFLSIDKDAKKLDTSAKFVLTQTQEACFSDKALNVSWSSTTEEREYTWADINPAIETDTHFFLFGEPHMAIIIPKFEMRGNKAKELRKFIEDHTNLISEVTGYVHSKI